MSDKTVALRAAVSFHSLTAGDIIHVDPDDPHYAALIDMGLLVYAYPEEDPQLSATVLAVSESGEETTVLGVAPVPRRRRKAAGDGEADSE